MNMNLLFVSRAEPPGWPLQATRGGDLLPGESTPGPVGAWTGPAGTLKGPAPAIHQQNTGAFWVQILMMNRRIHCCSYRHGLEWTGTGYRDWAGTKDSLSVTGESGDWVTKSADRTADSHLGHVFTLSVKLNLNFNFLPLFAYMFTGCRSSSTERNVSTPQLVPGRPVFF